MGIKFGREGDLLIKESLTLNGLEYGLILTLQNWREEGRESVSHCGGGGEALTHTFSMPGAQSARTWLVLTVFQGRF